VAPALGALRRELVFVYSRPARSIHLARVEWNLCALAKVAFDHVRSQTNGPFTGRHRETQTDRTFQVVQVLQLFLQFIEQLDLVTDVQRTKREMLCD